MTLTNKWQTTQPPVRLAVPTRGAFAEGTKRLLEQARLSPSIPHNLRKNWPSSSKTSNPLIEVCYYPSASEALNGVIAGKADAAITSLLLSKEINLIHMEKKMTGSSISVLMPSLGFGSAELCLAVKQNSSFVIPSSVLNANIKTPYPHLTREYLQRLSGSYSAHESRNSSSSIIRTKPHSSFNITYCKHCSSEQNLPDENEASALIIPSVTMLIENNLRVLDTILESEAALIAYSSRTSPRATEWTKLKGLQELQSALRSAIETLARTLNNKP
ncbi:MAG: hypothetical protein ABIH99_04725 [Candidatus Micrarchaeota archaeon]